jgi:serine/threonine protein kinase
MGRAAPLLVGRYAIHDRIAAGGMATVHLGRLVGEGGFARTVAIKRLHPHFATDPDFVSMFLDEGRLAARIRHPNVVQTLDVVVDSDEVFLVMDYVDGDSLAALIRAAGKRGETVPPACAVALVAGALHGLHAAHEAKSDAGMPLGIVHRDVSPQNILVGVDGVARVLDFGVAKALGQSHVTREGQLKGKLAYMSPEQIQGHEVDRRTDIFAASVVLWEVLTGRRLFKADGDAQILHRVLHGDIPRPSTLAGSVPQVLDDVVMRGLARDTSLRFPSAETMADALEEAVAPLAVRKVGAWVRGMFGDALVTRVELVREIEAGSHSGTRGSAATLRETPISGPSVPHVAAVPDLTDHAELVEPTLQLSSNVSSISVETPARAFVDRPRWRVVRGAAGVLVAGIVMLLGLALHGRQEVPASTSARGEPTSSAQPSGSPAPSTPWLPAAPSASPSTSAAIPSRAFTSLSALPRATPAPPRPPTSPPRPAGPPSSLLGRF